MVSEPRAGGAVPDNTGNSARVQRAWRTAILVAWVTPFSCSEARSSFWSPTS